MTVLFAVIAYQAQSTEWNYWDDEGYVMMTVSRFLHNKPLYTDVYSQYGPAYYLYQFVVLAPLGHRVTHDVVRWETIGIWITITLLASGIVFRLTRSIGSAFLVHLICSISTGRIVAEPGHPQGLCILLISIAAFLLTFLVDDRPRRNSILLCCIGICIGLLLATKINLGIYFLLACIMALLVQAPAERIINVIVLIAGPTCIAGFLYVLLRGTLYLPWVYDLACNVFIGAVSLLLVARSVVIRNISVVPYVSDQWLPLIRVVVPAVIGVVTGLVVPILFVVFRGTTLPDVWQGMVGQHVGFESVFMIPPIVVGNGQETVAHKVQVFTALSFVGLLLLFADHFLRNKTNDASISVRGINVSPTMLRYVIGFGLIALQLYIGINCLVETTTLQYQQQKYPYFFALLPVLWMAIPTDLVTLSTHYSKASIISSLPCLVVAFLAIFECLWVYPVVGNQRAMAAYLPDLLATVIFTRGIQGGFQMIQNLAERRGLKAIRQIRILSSLSVLIAIGIFVDAIAHYFDQTDAISRATATFVPIGLPGSRLIRLAPKKAQTLRSVANYLRENADTVIMVPGMYSFSFWSQIEPVNGQNAGAWPILFDDEKQKHLVELYRKEQQSKRVVVLFNPNALNIWISPDRHVGKVTDKPLFTYVGDEFEPRVQWNDYVVLTPATRKTVP